jgi:hypothetical protein
LLEADSNRFKTPLDLEPSHAQDQTYLIPDTGFKLKYAIRPSFALLGSAEYLRQATGDPVKTSMSHVRLRAAWLADDDWRSSLDWR